MTGSSRQDVPPAGASQPLDEPAVGLLARAVAGRPLAIRLQTDRATHTDGSTLWVVDGGTTAAIVVQAGLIAAGSLDERIMTKLLGRKHAAQRYLAYEARRVAVELRDVISPRVLRELEGLAVGAPSASPDESLARAQDVDGDGADPRVVGVLRPSLVLRNRSASAALNQDTTDTRLDRLRDFTSEEVDEGEEPPDADVRDKLTSPLGRNPIARLLHQLMDASFGASSVDGDGGAELQVGGARATREAGGPGRIALHTGVTAPAADEEIPGSVYPEWDFRRGAFRRAHCTVHHFDPTPQAARAELQMGSDHDLERVLARIGLSLERHRRLTDGESLDLRALVDFGVARASGEVTDARVYESRRPTAHDLGVVVLLDASGSTAEQHDGGERIWDEQRRLVAGLVGAFERVGDRVAAYAFRSHGRTDVRFLRIKHFDDRFDRPARRRLSDLDPDGYTRLGAAIRHGQAIGSQDAGTSRQLLVVVSDGLPYEEDYRGRYAEADVRHALEEAVDHGVACVCLSVGTSQDAEALDRIWGSVSHAHIADARRVAPHAEVLIRRALRSSLDASHGLKAPRRPQHHTSRRKA